MIKKIPKIYLNEVIDQYGLKLYNYIWHYSFNKQLLNQEFSFKKLINGKVYLFSKPYNQWAPAPFYTNFHSTHNISSENLINDYYQRTNRKKRKVFWFLKIDSFERYLEERTICSSKPSKHFPTTKNYLKKRVKINGIINIQNFDKEFYYYHHDRLKQKYFHDAETIFLSLINSNPMLPQEWIKTVTLSDNEEIVAIFLVIDDKRSISLINLASYRSNLSYGLVLCTDIIKYCCDNKYYSFDSGVSGMYGTYKDKIFLHSRELSFPQ